MKLKTFIGDDAYWIPPRLWSYAANEQTDGDFSDYSSQVLCDILGCSKHASSLLQALHDSGFMVQSKLNDWEEHNKFHAVNSLKARNAALKRHSKGRKKKTLKTLLLKEDNEREREREQAGAKQAPSMLQAYTSLNTEKFTILWEKWIKYRKGLKGGMVVNWDDFFVNQLQKLESWGVEKAYEAVERAMLNGWRGFFEPKDSKTSRPIRTMQDYLGGQK